MSETLRDLVVSLSLNSDNFSRNIKSINKQIQEAESAFRLASAGVENFETTTAGLSSKLSTLQRTFQLQQDAVGQYERALQQASDKLQECYARQNDYAQRLADAKDKQQQLKTEVAGAMFSFRQRAIAGSCASRGRRSGSIAFPFWRKRRTEVGRYPAAAFL